jgi:hypothetical protein
MQEVLNEGRGINNLILIFLTTKLLRPFTSWKAYSLGIIDKEGQELRKPGYTEKSVLKTSAEVARERDAWTPLDRFLAKVKRFLSPKVIAALGIFSTLLKEEKEENDDSFTKEYIIEKRKRDDRLYLINKHIKDILVQENITEEEYIRYLVNKVANDKELI